MPSFAYQPISDESLGESVTFFKAYYKLCRQRTNCIGPMPSTYTVKQG